MKKSNKITGGDLFAEVFMPLTLTACGAVIIYLDLLSRITELPNTILLGFTIMILGIIWIYICRDTFKRLTISGI